MMGRVHLLIQAGYHDKKTVPDFTGGCYNPQFPGGRFRTGGSSFGLKACRTRSLSEGQNLGGGRVQGVGWGPLEPQRKKHLVWCEVEKHRGALKDCRGVHSTGPGWASGQTLQLPAAATGQSLAASVLLTRNSGFCRKQGLLVQTGTQEPASWRFPTGQDLPGAPQGNVTLRRKSKIAIIQTP